ncbi:uncharacterized protein [Physcomitrium patens]|uniref:Rhodanese domain-containing protein n=2 Tax=Physcomitrium patens TaxID=3218 RepID=A0A2K1JU10_PHYPA|nr:uncharacterized protein LOC112288746 isoform X1 [Physcomitrium patens]PNR45015.1 hypothetical protein PHYPA_014785 [Physcomitrium patens]|eukprot:XP_024389042.1 uncharacterized protein LOC112288746 isoform X1 [Physcomitrella patens]
MADVDLADNTDDVLPLPALPSALFLHDVDELFSGEDDEPSPPASLKEQQPQRGGLRIQNVGGSLSFLLQIALCAWGIRQLRSVLARRRQNNALGSGRVNIMPYRPVEPPLFAFLSPTAVRKLVELDPTPYLLIDVRHPDAARVTPKLFENVINIPETEVLACLQLSAAEWKDRFPSTEKPGREDDLLVFLSTRGKRAQRVAAAAADLGYNGCCILKGGIQALRASSPPNGESLNFMSRDAVALLLQNKETLVDEKDVGAHTPWLIDLRRHDERALYGHIKGSLHIRVEEWPKAMAKDAAAYEKQYHAPKIGTDDIVILHCRTRRRASWAAHVAQDAGLKRVFVYKEGAYGWRLDPTVLPYDSYEMGDAPPEPVKFDLERVDFESAQAELKHLGLMKSRVSGE